MLTTLLRLVRKLSGSLLGGAAVGSQLGAVLVCLFAVVFGQSAAVSLLAR